MLDPRTFSIGDISGEEFAPYEHGGIARQLKIPKKIDFVSANLNIKDDTCAN